MESAAVFQPWSPCSASVLLLAAAFAGLGAPALAAPGAAVERLHQLARLYADMGENRSDQEEAWPNREHELEEEKEPPPRVRRLQKELARLNREAQSLLELVRIDFGVRRDTFWLEESSARRPSVDPLLAALERSEDVPFIAAIVPIAVAVARDDPGTLRVLTRLAARLDPCPAAISAGLSSLENEEAWLFLLELGLKRSDASLLRAAAGEGRPAVIAELIRSADGQDRDTAQLALEALRRLAPPGQRQRADLATLIAAQTQEAQSPELRATLVAYLGLFRDARHLALFKRVYGSSKDNRLRCAAVGAMGQLGAEAGPFLLAELSSRHLSRPLADALVRAIGATRHRAATPQLVELLSEPELSAPARQALARIAGSDLGDKKALWRRWWLAQPEAIALGIDGDGV